MSLNATLIYGHGAPYSFYRSSLMTLLKRLWIMWQILYSMRDKKDYVSMLASCRDKAMRALINEYPGIPGVFGRMTSFFTVISSRLDGIEVGDEELQYKLLLAVSFMRSHVCACEHIFRSENIEAVTLMRKQLELIARMKEVDVKDSSELYNKVPNVSFGRPMNVLYGLMSKIAHSSHLDSLDMLGYNMADETHKHISLFPLYLPDTVRSFDVAIGLFLMFLTEAIHIQKVMLPEYDIRADGDAFMEFIEYGRATNIPFFKSLDA